MGGESAHPVLSQPSDSICFWIPAGEDIHSPKDGMSLGHKSKAFTFSSSALKYSVREEKKGGGGAGGVEGVDIQKKKCIVYLY